MIPRLTLKERFLAWILWRIEGFQAVSLDNVEWQIDQSNLLRCTTLLRDKYYIERAKEYDKFRGR